MKIELSSQFPISEYQWRADNRRIILRELLNLGFWQILAIVLVLCPKLIIGQNIYSQSQFEKSVNTVTNAISDAEKEYKKVENSVKSLFPKGSRQSSFYLIIKQDYRTYRESMKKLDKFKVSLSDNHNEYKKLFSTGLLKSVENIRFGDNNWDRVEAVAAFLDNTLEEAEKELNGVYPLQNRFTTFVEKMGGVVKSISELKSSAAEANKAYKKIEKRDRELRQKFAELDTGLARYEAYKNAVRIREDLQKKINQFSITNDAIKKAEGNMTRLVHGKSKPGELKRVWEVYQGIIDEHAELTTNIVEINQETDEFQEKLEDVLNLLHEFEKSLAEMERDISKLVDRQQRSEISLETDQKRHSSLLDVRPKQILPDDFPYKGLTDAFRYSEQILGGTDRFILDVTRIRNQFVELAGRMNSLKGSNKQYDRFKKYKKEFKDVFKKANKRYDEYLDAREKFESVILGNFINTQEYWDIRYATEEKKSFGGNRTISENYGYLFNMNEYPDQPYHGKLVSDYQLRLKMEKSKGQREWTYTFIFTGTNDFLIEGIALVDNDSVLYETSHEDVDVMEEKRDKKKGKVNFEWELPVGKDIIFQLVNANQLDVKIHLMTTTHRIAHTLHLQKIFKIYTVPPERMKQWKKMVLEPKA